MSLATPLLLADTRLSTDFAVSAQKMDYGASEVVDLAKKKKPATVCMVRLESFRVGTRVSCYIPLSSDIVLR